MKKNDSYNVSDTNYGWIFILILVILFGCAAFGGYALYEHATSPDNDYSFSEHTDLRDISSTNTATNLYNIISSNSVYFEMFYKDKLSNSDYLEYAFSRSNINIPALFGEKFTVLKNKIDISISSSFYNDNEKTSLYVDAGYNNYQFKCAYSVNDSLYNCITSLSDISNVVMLYSNFDKVEQESEFFYVYDKAVFAKINENTASFYTDINYKNNIVLCDNSLALSDTVCTGFTDDTTELSDYVFKQYADVINTYKHTFIKKNGNYYYVSTEIVNEEAVK